MSKKPVRKYKKHIPPELDKRKNNHRPSVRHKIDYDEVKRLCSIGCTQAEVASFLEISHDVLEQDIVAVHGVKWKEFFKEHSNKFKVSLRRLQFRSAEGDYDEDGNKYRIFPSIPMQIWLGKQFLGQKDRQEIEHNEKTDIPLFEWADAEDVTNQKHLNEKTNNSDEDSDVDDE